MESATWSNQLRGTQAGCPAYDVHTDLITVLDVLLKGEQIYGVYAGCGTEVRFIAVTSRRLVMLETTFGEDRAALTSAPLSRVTSVSYVLSPGQSAHDAITVAIRVNRTTYEVTCYSARQAHDVHDLIIWNLIDM